MAHRDHHHHHHNHAELTKEDDKKVTEKKEETKAAKVEEVSGKEVKKAVKEPEIVEEPVVAVAEPLHHHHHIASLGEAEESSLGSFVGLSKPGDADYADTFEAAATALREGTAPKTRYDSKMQNIASAIVALEDELRVSSYQPLLRAFSAGSGAGNGLGVSRLGRARSRTPLLDEWVEMARRRPDRDAALSTLRAAFGTGPKARRAMRIMVNDIRKAR